MKITNAIMTLAALTAFASGCADKDNGTRVSSKPAVSKKDLKPESTAPAPEGKKLVDDILKTATPDKKPTEATKEVVQQAAAKITMAELEGLAFYGVLVGPGTEYDEVASWYLEGLSDNEVADLSEQFQAYLSNQIIKYENDLQVATKELEQVKADLANDQSREEEKAIELFALQEEGGSPAEIADAQAAWESASEDLEYSQNEVNTISAQISKLNDNLISYYLMEIFVIDELGGVLR